MFRQYTGKLAELYKSICTKEQSQGALNPECKSAYTSVTTEIRQACMEFNNLVSAVKVHLPKTAAKAKPKKKVTTPKDESDDD